MGVFFAEHKFKVIGETFKGDLRGSFHRGWRFLDQGKSMTAFKRRLDRYLDRKNIEIQT